MVMKRKKLMMNILPCDLEDCRIKTKQIKNTQSVACILKKLNNQMKKEVYLNNA